MHDLNQIAIFLETGVYDLAASITLLVLSFVVITVWEPSVAVSVAGVVPLLAILTVAQMRPAARAYRDQRIALGAVVERLQEDFAGRHVIEAAGAEEESRNVFVRHAFVLRQARKRAQTIANTYIEVMTWIAALAGAALDQPGGRRGVRRGALGGRPRGHAAVPHRRAGADPAPVDGAAELPRREGELPHARRAVRGARPARGAGVRDAVRGRDG